MHQEGGENFNAILIFGAGSGDRNDTDERFKQDHFK